MLRQFGVTMAIAVGLIFGFVLPWLFNYPYPRWPWWVVAFFAISGVAYPALLGPVYRIWMRFGLVIGAINSRIILAILFFLVFVPVSLVLRTFGRDAMARRLDNKIETYRVAARRRRPEDLERPF